MKAKGLKGGETFRFVNSPLTWLAMTPRRNYIIAYRIVSNVVTFKRKVISQNTLYKTVEVI